MQWISWPIAFTLLILLSSLVSADEQRPNFLLIMADDVGCDAVGCYGGTSYPTPQIDKLAAGGMRFDYCYSMPSCHPTRMTLLTGRYPRRLGNPKWGSFPPEEEPRTIAQVAKSGGYQTAVAGKWQLSLLSQDLRQPTRMGFDQYSLFGWHEGPRYYRPLIFQDGSVREDVSAKYGPDVYSDVLIEFMRRNREQPFFAYFPMALCHDVTDDLEEPVPYGPRGRYDTFAEMMTEMDRVVGKVIGAVDELGLRERTLILFTCDNGTPKRSILRAENGKYIREPVFSMYRGKRIQGGKTTLLDGGTHVPLIASWPGTITANRVCEDLVDFSDFLPTIAEITGGDLPEEVTLDGRSFAPQLRGEAGDPRQWAYAEGRRGAYWVRNRKWKLYNDGRFYAVGADPQETRPLDTDELTEPAAQAYRELQAAIKQVKTFE